MSLNLIPNAWSILKAITVEPGVFLKTFAFGLQQIISQNLLIERVCTVNLNHTQDVCSHLNNHKDIQIDVQHKVNLISMGTLVIQAIPGIFLCLFIGSWSDMKGRKPLMILPLIGGIISNIILLALAYFEDINAHWYLLMSITGLFGGFACFLTGIFSFISDISQITSRTTRIAILDFHLFAGYPIGVGISAILFSEWGYYGVFSIAAALEALNLVFFTFFIRETKGPNATYISSSNQNLISTNDSEDQEQSISLFHYKHFVNVFKTCFKPRPHKMRRAILLLIFMMLLNLSVFTSSITYLYTRYLFNWTEKEYTFWSSMSSICTSIGAVIILPLLSFKLKIHDCIIGCVGALSGLAATLVLALISRSWMMYLSSGLGVMSTSSAIIIRAILSKIGPASDLGKIFALLSCLESAIPLISVPVLTLIYNSTITWFPGATYATQSCIFGVIFCIMAYIYHLLKQNGVQYGEIESQESDSSEEHDDSDLLDNSSNQVHCDT